MLAKNIMVIYINPIQYMPNRSIGHWIWVIESNNFSTLSSLAYQHTHLYMQRFSELTKFSDDSDFHGFILTWCRFVPRNHPNSAPPPTSTGNNYIWSGDLKNNASEFMSPPLLQDTFPYNNSDVFSILCGVRPKKIKMMNIFHFPSPRTPLPFLTRWLFPLRSDTRGPWL